MKFNDFYVSRKERFSMGVEETSGQFYVSFPVSSGFVDYEEYYAIHPQMFERFQNDVAKPLHSSTAAAAVNSMSC